MATKCTSEEPTSKTIRISFTTYQDLAKLGTFGDSFDSVIRCLLSDKDYLSREENHQTVQKGRGIPSNPLTNPDQSSRRQSITPPRPSGANRYDY